MIGLTTQAIDPRAVEAAVADPGMGAVLTFIGVTRDTFERRRVTRLEYEAYDVMALSEMGGIVTEAQARWPGVRVAMVHRLGIVPAQEASIVICVGAPHRAAAYEASRFAIDALKERVPIWKKEIYEDGSAWKANAPGDPDQR